MWNIADSTRTRYGNSYGNHIKPHIRSVPIKRLTASQVQAAFKSYIIPEAE
ncbi:hypothetical protein [Bifidobacterium breve]|uniref:hypothetical protein n=1 Tax=Bifidobacterium breve TaxID=1685 RepID=UPI0012D7C83A